MKNEIPGPFIVMLGEGNFSIGPAIIPKSTTDDEPIVAIVINRLPPKGAVPLLVDLSGKPLGTPNQGQPICLIGCPTRQAVTTILKACVSVLDLFDRAEARADEEQKGTSPSICQTPP